MKLRIATWILLSFSMITPDFAQNPVPLVQGPQIILLRDADIKMPMLAKRSGNNWNIESRNAPAYLKAIATAAGESDLRDFSEISISFDSTESRGLLTGLARDTTGARVSLGVEFKWAGLTPDTNVNTMIAGTRHLCTGQGCQECDGFIVNEFRITGCRPCSGGNGNGKCSHSLHTIQK